MSIQDPTPKLSPYNSLRQIRVWNRRDSIIAVSMQSTCGSWIPLYTATENTHHTHETIIYMSSQTRLTRLQTRRARPKHYDGKRARPSQENNTHTHTTRDMTFLCVGIVAPRLSACLNTQLQFHFRMAGQIGSLCRPAGISKPSAIRAIIIECTQSTTNRERSI